MTVLFADVVHSMDIVAAVGPERLREILAAVGPYGSSHRLSVVGRFDIRLSARRLRLRTFACVRAAGNSRRVVGAFWPNGIHFSLRGRGAPGTVINVVDLNSVDPQHISALLHHVAHA